MELSAAVESAVWWSSLLLLKLATFPVIVGQARMSRKVFANEEDVAGNEGAQVKTTDVVVERRRR